MVEDLGGSAQDAPQRVVDDEDRDAGGHLDPAGQARQERPAAGEADLPAHHVLGEVRRDVRQHLPHRRHDHRDDILQRPGDEPAGHVLDPGVAARHVHADRFHPSGPSIGQAQVHLQVPGGVAADEQAEVGLDGVHDRLIHGVAAQAQRLGAHQVAAGHHRDLGGPAADVHDERAGPVGRADAGPGGGGDRFLDELDVAPGLDRPGGHRQGPLLDPGGPARERRSPPTAAAGRGAARRGAGTPAAWRPTIKVGDDPIPQRVNDLDALRLLAGQDVRGLPHGADLPVARSTAIAEGSSMTAPGRRHRPAC